MTQRLPKAYTDSLELDELREKWEKDTRLVSLLISRVDEVWLDYEKESERADILTLFIEQQGEDTVQKFIEYVYTELKDSVFELDGEPIPPYVVKPFGVRLELSENSLTEADFPKPTKCD